MTNHRVDEFSGTNDEYIKYLEDIVRALRTDSRSTASQASYSPSESVVAVPAKFPDLEIVQWVPEPNPRKRSRNNPTTGCKLPSWKEKAAALIQITPTAQQWWQRVEDIGMFEVVQSGHAAMFMLDGSFPMPNTSDQTMPSEWGKIAQPTDLLGRLTAYAWTARNREVNASLALMLARFQQFLLLSACAVVYYEGSPKKQVLDVVRICVGDVTDRYCMQVLRTAKYLNELVDALNAQGWKDRASELLLIWNKPTTWYFAISSSPRKSIGYLKARLASPEFTTNLKQSTEWTPFFVPSLVYQILDKQYHVARIGRALGYQNAQVLQEAVNPWAYFEGP